MELVSYDFPSSGRDGKPLILMPVGDIQWFGDETEVALEMLQRHIAWGVKQGAWFIGMGDYIDTFSPSNRDKLQAALLYDSARKGIDHLGEKLIDDLYKILKPSRGRWLGLLEGHHYHVFQDGTTTDQRLAGLLQTKFLGTSAYVRLLFNRGKSRGAVVIWAHHGQGGGTSAQRVVNKLLPITRDFEADIYLLGHFTSKDGKPMDKIRPWWGKGKTAPKLVHRTILLVGTGGFAKGYIEGRMQGRVPRGGYVEQGMYPPAALGGPLVKITPRWKQLPDGSDIWLPDLGVEL